MEEKQEGKIFTYSYTGRDPRGFTENDLKELKRIREKYTLKTEDKKQIKY